MLTRQVALVAAGSGLLLGLAYVVCCGGGVSLTHASPLKRVLAQHVQVSGPVLGWSISAIAWSLVVLGLATPLRVPFVFMWNCFVKPFLGEDKFDQKARLDS